MQNEFGIDWLTLTIRVDYWAMFGSRTYSANTLISLFCDRLEKITNGYIEELKFQQCPYGINRFDTMWKWGGENHFVLCSSQRNQKLDHLVMLQLSGQGIRELGTIITYQILMYCMDNGCNVTRLDLCYDDYDGTIPVKKLVRSFEQFINGQTVISSNYRQDKANIYYGCFDGTPYKNIVFGSRTASQYFRLYDKRAEQADHENPYWYRLEMELRKEAAHAGAEYIVKNWPDIATTSRYFLNRMFRVLSREPKSEREAKELSRIPVAPWWKEFVLTEDRAKVVYSKPSVEHTVFTMLRHVKESYAGYIKTLMDLEPDRLMEILDTAGREQQSRLKYRRLIEDYQFRANRGNPVEWTDFEEL